MIKRNSLKRNNVSIKREIVLEKNELLFQKNKIKKIPYRIYEILKLRLSEIILFFNFEKMN